VLLAHSNQAPDIVIFLVQPHIIPKILKGVPPAVLAKAWRICMAVLELPYAPPRWLPLRNFFHEVWTPSDFSARCMRQFMNAEIRVVPHLVVQPADGQARPPDGLRDKFEGLAILDLAVCPDRKNPHAHIEAWQKAFGSDERAVLTMKLRFSRRTRVIRSELREMIGDAKNVRLIERELSDQAILALQGAADVGLSLHRAEGYGLTIQEMLELGKPVVATGWSGNMTYMVDYAQAYPVPFKLVPYHDYLRRYPGYSGCWAEADTDAAARLLRKIAYALMQKRAHSIGTDGRPNLGGSGSKSRK
jgi:glycosyltransferase involved in cell wall biosynthesis